MTRTISAAFFGFVMVITTADAQSANAADAADSWLPLQRSEVFGILTQGSDIDAAALQTLDESLNRARSELASDPARLERLERRAAAERQRLGPDETIWIVQDPALPFWITMAGDGERVHSLRIIVPLVNLSDEENARTYKALSALFTAIYPDWPDAAAWPATSLVTAWNNHPLARKTPLTDPDDVFVRKADHGITSTTFGVPPDIVVYDVTVRERCIPVHAQGNPFKRLIC